MNATQRIVLIAGLSVALGMILFPPWKYVYDLPKPFLTHAERPAGYHLIFIEPIPNDQSELGALFGLEKDTAILQFFSVKLDGSKTAVQVVAVLFLTAILYFFVPKSPKAGTH